MFLELLFWLIVVFSCIFGFGAITNAPWGRYGWFPMMVLFIIVGLKIFGSPLH